MNKQQIIFLVIWLLNTCPIAVFGQTSRGTIDSLASVLEKLGNKNIESSIYLRTDKNIYETTENLWFKAYSVDLKHFQLSAQDHSLYVQLVQSKNDSVVWEEVYPIKEGLASGHIYLDNALEQGHYWLCAYSSSSVKNKKEQFVDARRIKIIENLKQLDVHRKEQHPDSTQDVPLKFDLFPESGILLAGVRNKIAFKASSKNGHPLEISGRLFENEKEIAVFKSIHDGMGYFYSQPESGKTYAVQLDQPYQGKAISLPKAAEVGMAFSLLDNTDDTLTLKVFNRSEGSQSFFIQVQTRGIPSVIASGEVKDSILVKLPLIEVPYGISEITLMNGSAVPVAERLVYIKPNKKMMITTEVSKSQANKREKIKIKINARDQYGKPVVAHLGATVYDRIYNEPTDGVDIQTHYLVSNQIRGRVHNPSYYFDTSNNNRNTAMDLLLLTQGWRSYVWSQEALREMLAYDEPIIANTVSGKLVSKKRKKSDNPQQAAMLFNAEQNVNQLVEVGGTYTFEISPEHMHIGKDVYIKHFGQPADYELTVVDPFKKLHDAQFWKKIQYPFLTESFKKEDESPYVNLSGRSIKLEEVVISAKKENIFRDKYIGSLDSLAKYQNNTDRAHGSWLNCPAGDGDEMPIEGKTYIVWTGPNPPTSHPFYFNSSNTKKIVYRYPKYTEEELMKMNGVTRTKGYYPEKEFYQPDYETAHTPSPDFRNTLLWAPNIITDKNGSATIEFFTSDINSVFLGIIEGIDANGIFGKSAFQLRVNP
ncbi:hypothetical protein [Sphingobacterium suaedae]|uniref:MG2 domain protein n=1 Tax=Sphingobacterium suaedae TaxID=1686402 RepID=A0ABW5KLH1_9SPHI